MRETPSTNTISTTYVNLNVHKRHVPYITYLWVIWQTWLYRLSKTSVLYVLHATRLKASVSINKHNIDITIVTETQASHIDITRLLGYSPSPELGL